MATIQIAENISVRIRMLESYLCAMPPAFAYLTNAMNHTAFGFIEASRNLPYRFRPLATELLAEISREEQNLGLSGTEDKTIGERHEDLVNAGSDFMRELFEVYRNF